MYNTLVNYYKISGSILFKTFCKIQHAKRFKTVQKQVLNSCVEMYSIIMTLRFLRNRMYLLQTLKKLKHISVN